MADEKPKVDAPKPDAKAKPAEAPAVEKKHPLREIGEMFFAFFILSSVLGGLSNTLGNIVGGNGFHGLSTKNLLSSYTRPFASVLNPIGGFAVVTASSGTDVYNEPGAQIVGTQAQQATGRVTKGPVSIEGKTYWYIDFDEGTDGWVNQDDIGYRESTERALTAKEKKDTEVVTTEEQVGVSKTAGGQVFTTESKHTFGKIVRGPESSLGVMYYYVHFDDDTEGWVRADKVQVVEPVPEPLLARIIFWIYTLASYLKYVLWFLAFVLLCVLVYVAQQLNAIRTNVRRQLYPEVVADEALNSHNPQWERVITHVESNNEGDWRLAIIEADIMLSDLLNTMNLLGDSIGEKLKGVEKSDFTTLDLAWEAHKVRNQIAHDSSFTLSQREAKRVIGLFEAVFDEFSFI